MNTDKTGGFVHPQAARSGDLAIAEGGMTLLDHYAGLAMQAIVADPNSYHPNANWRNWCADVADQAYDIAEAMIAQRARRN